MNSNPIRIVVDKKEAERLEVAKGSHLPIHVCCVLDEYSDFNDPVLHEIRNHCAKNNVLFTTRLYDSNKYNCDRDYIERLPALHIFTRRLYMETFYPSTTTNQRYSGSTRPIQHVDDAIKAYNSQLETRRLKKQYWRRQLTGLLEWFRSLLKKKTRMELYAEEYPIKPTRDWSSRMVMTPD